MSIDGKCEVLGPIVLDPKKAFEFDVRAGVKNLIKKEDGRNDIDAFYHIFVYEDKITIEKQGYNIPTYKMVEFDMSQLSENQKFDAVRAAYSSTFFTTHELVSRVSTVMENSLADSHNGASHTFYHDRTAKWRESEIASEIFRMNPDLFDQSGRKRR